MRVLFVICTALALMAITTPPASSGTADASITDQPTSARIALISDQWTIHDPAAMILLGAALIATAAAVRRGNGGDRAQH
jgi:hypothetical protein